MATIPHHRLEQVIGLYFHLQEVVELYYQLEQLIGLYFHLEEVVELLTSSKIAGILITKDKEQCRKYVETRFEHFEGKFSNDNVITVTKSLMNQYAKEENNIK